MVCAGGDAGADDGVDKRGMYSEPSNDNVGPLASMAASDAIANLICLTAPTRSMVNVRLDARVEERTMRASVHLGWVGETKTMASRPAAENPK